MNPTILLVIIINLILVLVISWGYMFYKMDSYLRRERLLRKNLGRLKERLDMLRESQLKTRKAKLSEDSKKEVSEQQHTISQLNVLNQRNKKIIESLDEATIPHEIEKTLKAQIASLKTQSSKYEQAVDRLTKQNESSSYRMEFLEDKLQRAQKELSELHGMESKEYLTSLKNESLQRQLKNAKDHTSDGKPADKAELLIQKRQNEKLVDEVSRYQDQLTRQTAELEQLMKEYERMEKEVADSQRVSAQEELKDNQEIEQIYSEIAEIQDELDRTLKEKDFIESQFIEVVDSLDKKVEIEDELVRTKTEYNMLEDHFLEATNKPKTKRAAKN